MKKYFILTILFGFTCSVVSFAQSTKTEEMINQMETAGKLKRIGGNTLAIVVAKPSNTVQVRKKYENVFKKPDGSNYEIRFSIDPKYIQSNKEVRVNKLPQYNQPVNTDSNVIFTAPTVTTNPASFTVPVSGAGTRMMWLPGKSAFRAGTVTGTQWNADSIGTWSFASGYDTKAKGTYSTAMGYTTNANGSASTAMGYTTNANGRFSIAAGQQTVSNSYASLTIGRFNDSIASSSKEAWVTTDPLLILGNGNSVVARSNALVVYKNGNTDINGYTQLGKSSEGAPAIKQKKITGFYTPATVNPNTFTFVPHGLDASKILSISVMVSTSDNFDILPNSPDEPFIYTVNTDPTVRGGGPSIAIGVKSGVQSYMVMGCPIKILITYEE